MLALAFANLNTELPSEAKLDVRLDQTDTSGCQKNDHMPLASQCPDRLGKYLQKYNSVSGFSWTSKNKERELI
jgi:hypothetical protein